MRPADHTSRLARGELADSESAGRDFGGDPEGAMRRREFLERTAIAAGSAGLAGALGADELVAAAAKRAAARRPLPSPRNLPVDTFVVLMMENRSFDHYFGWHPRADGRNRGLRYQDLEGNSHPTHRLPPDWQGCAFRDPDHGWRGGRHQYGNGRMDGFYRGNATGTGSDEYALGYYLAEDLSFLPAVARKYTVYDRWFCSLMASTFPNRHYQMAAQSGGTKSNVLPVDDMGFQWETIFDRALARGVSVGYYASDLPAPGLYGARGLAWVRPAIQFYTDALAGTLPNICFVDPPFGDIGALGLGASDHPHSDIRAGQAFMSDIVHAFIASQQYRRGAMFINYDEWGGFFDHVKPPFVPDDRRSRNLYEDFGFAGFRIPGLAISPYARGGRVSHMNVTHESILKLISYRFRLGYLNKRHRYASNIGRSLDFESPDFDPPSLPDPAAILGLPCAIQGGGAGARADKPHDMAKLQTSGLLDRLGYEVPKLGLEHIFRMPDKAKRAFEAGNEARLPGEQDTRLR